MRLNGVLVLAIAVLFTSCASTGPTGGGLYHDIKYGINANDSENASKTGTACQSSILGLFGFGDASIDTAKKESGITKVSSIDASSFNVLGLYNKYCSIIKGN